MVHIRENMNFIVSVEIIITLVALLIIIIGYRGVRKILKPSSEEYISEEKYFSEEETTACKKYLRYLLVGSTLLIGYWCVRLIQLILEYPWVKK